MTMITKEDTKPAIQADAELAALRKLLAAVKKLDELSFFDPVTRPWCPRENAAMSAVRKALRIF